MKIACCPFKGSFFSSACLRGPPAYDFEWSNLADERVAIVRGIIRLSLLRQVNMQQIRADYPQPHQTGLLPPDPPPPPPLPPPLSTLVFSLQSSFHSHTRVFFISRFVHISFSRWSHDWLGGVRSPSHHLVACRKHKHLWSIVRGHRRCTLLMSSFLFTFRLPAFKQAAFVRLRQIIILL